MMQKDERVHRIPASLIERPDFIAACAARDMGTVFALASRYGLSKNAMFRLTGVKTDHIRQVIDGRRRIEGIEVFERIADGLGIPGHMLGLARRSWEPVSGIGGAVDLDLDSKRSIDGAEATLPDPVRRAHEWLVEDSPQIIHTRAGRRVGRELVEQVEARVIELRLLDDVVGGEDLAPAVEQELFQTNCLIQEASFTEAIGKRLLVASAELSQLAGWTLSDAGRHAEAHRTYVAGVDAASTAADKAVGANLLSSLAYQWSNIGNPHDALLLARTAAVGASDASPAVRALLLERVAWSAARACQEDAAQRALAAVDDAFDQRSTDISEPHWVYWLNRDEIDIMAARVSIELDRPDRAAGLLIPVLSSYPQENSRESALYWTVLAEGYANAGERDGACEALDEARLFAARVRSPRADERVKQVAALISR